MSDTGDMSNSDKPRQPRRKKQRRTKRNPDEEDEAEQRPVELTLYQKIDDIMLGQLELLQPIGVKGKEREGLIDGLALACKMSNSNMIKCEYRSKYDGGRLYGRFVFRKGAATCYATHTLNFPKPLQRILNHKIMYDIDMASANQTIAVYYAQLFGESRDHLYQVCVDRKKYIAQIQSEGCKDSAEELKEKLIRILNGSEERVFGHTLLEYKAEVDRLTERLKAVYSEQWRDAQVWVREQNEHKNATGVFMSRLVHAKEREVVNVAKDYLISLDYDVQSWEHDGLKIERQETAPEEFPTRVLQALNNHCLEKTHINVRFVQKSLALTKDEIAILQGPRSLFRLRKDPYRTIEEINLMYARQNADKGFCRFEDQVLQNHESVPGVRVKLCTMNEFTSMASKHSNLTGRNLALWETWFKTVDHINFPIVNIDSPKDIICFRNGWVRLAKERPVFTKWTADELRTRVPNEGFVTNHFFNVHVNDECIRGEAPTPAIDTLLSLQFPDPWVMHVVKAFLGRLLFPLHMYDDWELAVTAIGVAGSGKSSLLNMLLAMFPPDCILRVSGGFDPKFGLYKLKDKHMRLLVIDELEKDFSSMFRQGDLQSLISGNKIEVGQKGKDTVEIASSVPMIFCGNGGTGGGALAGMNDESGQLTRRLVCLKHDKAPKHQDPFLKHQLTAQLVPTMFALINSYYKFKDKVGSQHARELLPPELVYTPTVQRKVRLVTEFVEHYVFKCDPGSGKNVLFSVMRTAIEAYLNEHNRIKNITWDEDTEPFSLKGIQNGTLNACRFCKKHVKGFGDSKCCKEYDGKRIKYKFFKDCELRNPDTFADLERVEAGIQKMQEAEAMEAQAIEIEPMQVEPPPKPVEPPPKPAVTFVPPPPVRTDCFFDSVAQQPPPQPKPQSKVPPPIKTTEPATQHKKLYEPKPGAWTMPK